VDIGHVSAHRIFDLLGLYDRAAGLITADTATAHLAVGSKVPAIWFTIPDWRGSVPRGNCVWHCTYAEILGKIEEIMAVVESWK
jgi:ADP-heptose:LPS heptosyltransferase